MGTKRCHLTGIARLWAVDFAGMDLGFNPESQIQQLARRTLWQVICIKHHRQRQLKLLGIKNEDPATVVPERLRSVPGAVSALTAKSSSERRLQKRYEHYSGSYTFAWWWQP
jgi:hypothetical protein